MSSVKMSCRRLVNLITEYLEGSLSPEERARFDDHLRQCDGCTEYLSQMRRTLTEVGQLREDSLDPSMRDTLLAAFRDWTARRT